MKTNLGFKKKETKTNVTLYPGTIANAKLRQVLVSSGIKTFDELLGIFIQFLIDI